MKRIGILAGAMGASLIAALADLGHNIVTIDRERPVSAKRRHVAPASWFTGNRSKYMPHIGKKEQERAKLRCYMVSAYIGGVPRSAPCMMQTSKRDQLPF